MKQKLVWIAAFGYFVDLFDLVLYGVVRVDSLKSLGYQTTDLFHYGSLLLNFQMGGMLVGGVLWGIIGDQRGRRQALFGSILIYSIATFLNAYVHSIEGYAALRFLAGFGLAGELGAAITIVGETLPQGQRGYGSTLIASVGFFGAAVCAYYTQQMSWQSAYRLGGILGFALLLARMGVSESKLYLKARDEDSKSRAEPKEFGALIQKSHWGSLGVLFGTRERRQFFLFALLAGVPIWYVAGILSYFAPEFARELGTVGEVSAGTTILMSYLGAILGDICCGLFSQWIQSRKAAVFTFMILSALLSVFHPFFMKGGSADAFYWMRFWIGFTTGFFAVLIAWISEIFGTNLRTTATTTLSNLIRASVIPLTIAFQMLKPVMSLNLSSTLIGFVAFAVALKCVTRLPETFHRSLDFIDLNPG